LPATREKYIKRELGFEPVEVDFKNLKRALEVTNGILLYEESAMYIAQDAAGWDLNEADALRKISKLKGSNPKLVIDTENKFIEDCANHSKISRRDAKYIWDDCTFQNN
jgi:DNA polymerase III alpha subunit